MEALIEKVKKAGLGGNEARIYLELLRRGSISANDLARKMGMDRTLAYQVLNKLMEKGLANHIIKENKKYFAAASPDNLLSSIKEHESIILSVIPELNKIEKLKEKEQEVKVYEGKRGLRVLFEDVLKSKNICVFGASGKSFDALKFEIPYLAKKSLKAGMKGRMITSNKFRRHEMTKLPNLKARFLEEVESHATTTIYDDKVAINIVVEKPIVIIIKNADVADGYRSYFEFLWKTAKL